MGAHRVRGAAAVLAVAALIYAAPVAAATPTWHLITASNGSNTDEVALLRTPDGTLHVTWRLQSGTFSSLHHTPISPGGRVEPGSTITAGWASMNNPALVAAPGGALRAFFGGIHSTDPTDTNNDLNTAVSTDGGSSWTVRPGDVAAPGGAASASPVSATDGAGLTPYEAWFNGSGVWVHAGLSPTTPNQNFQTPLGDFGDDPNLAADAGGDVVLAWHSDASGHSGVFAQRVNPDGSPAGSPAVMPGTSDLGVGQLSRTPLVARAGGGFYIAYMVGLQVRLWRVDSASASLVARVPAIGQTPKASIAAAPDGRLWVMWVRDVRDIPHVFAVRSNRAATRWGAVVDGGAPGGADTGYQLAGNATAGALDVFGGFSIGVFANFSTWYTRLHPGLSLRAHFGAARGRTTRVTFLVTDAGDPVKGARVRADGRAATTNRRGQASLTLKVPFSTTATASARGYTAARIRVAAVT